MEHHIPEFISQKVTEGDYYFLNLSPKKDSNETVVCGGREVCSPRYRIDRAGVKYLTIEYVVAGRGTLYIRGKHYELRPGMLYSYGPHIPHAIGSDPKNPLIKHFICFVGHELTELLRHTVFAVNTPLYAAKPFIIQSIFDNLIVTGKTQYRHREALCALMLRQLILMADEIATDATLTSSQAWQTYFRCRQYIEQNYQDISSVHDAARQCFINQAYMTRLFKRFANESPLQLLNRLKMTEAAELLCNRTMLVKEVAEALGYNDSGHFSRVFKGVYGIPPKNLILSDL